MIILILITLIIILIRVIVIIIIRIIMIIIKHLISPASLFGRPGRGLPRARPSARPSLGPRKPRPAPREAPEVELAREHVYGMEGAKPGSVHLTADGRCAAGTEQPADTLKAGGFLFGGPGTRAGLVVLLGRRRCLYFFIQRKPKGAPPYSCLLFLEGAIKRPAPPNPSKSQLAKGGPTAKLHVKSLQVSQTNWWQFCSPASREATISKIN